VALDAWERTGVYATSWAGVLDGVGVTVVMLAQAILIALETHHMAHKSVSKPSLSESGIAFSRALVTEPEC
jgi:hypothetical protein